MTGRRSKIKISDKRKVGEILGRKGLSEEIIRLVEKFIEDKTYKNAVVLAGALSVIADACTFDEYWNEKMLYGKYNEIYNFENILAKKDISEQKPMTDIHGEL